MLSVMSLKVIIKVDTVITAAETERETSLESDMCGVVRTAGAGPVGPPPHTCGPPRIPSLVRAEGPPGTRRDPQLVKQNSRPGAAINLPSPRTRSILA